MADCCVYSPDEDGYCDYCGRFHDEDNDAAPSIQPTEARITELENALNISPDDVGRIMHESWSKTKRTQGFHGPNEPCTAAAMTARFYCDNCRFDEISKTWSARCQRFHPDLVPWDELPEAQKDINRRAFDAVIEEIRRRANREAARKVMGGGAQNLP